MIRPGGLLMVAPHPDDETIGGHAMIARMRRRGVPVRVLIVSDGAGSHRGSTAWPRQRLVRERRRETRMALHRIGVTARVITFLDLPDGDVAAHGGAISRGVARALATLPRPVLALAPSPRDHHPDHRAVAAAARPAHGVRWLAYPVWPTGQRLPAARAMPLTAQERLAKRHAIRRYRTQTGRITDDPTGFALSAAQIAAFSRPGEVFAAIRR
ncbi:PIG-L deacetylase family protein [Sphingomonas sp. Leaf22]|uniref:PIG-L deacetylase family protein n=1 Tax=Sphingomonas sp. Leaf22 TaxID=1735687 RepID=UPI000A52417A|nr:PIG-L family deacetylase [Sphingomonas sp. Leaf22]